MSILIKGMEMPKSCKECQVSFGYGNDVYCPFLFEPCDAIEDGTMWKECPKEGGLADCPLIEVQSPHGRLIDADALHDAMYHRAFETDGDTMWQSGCWVRYRAIEQVHESQPTIIEAEGSDT